MREGGTRVEWLQHLSVVDYIILIALIVAFAIGWARGLVDILLGFMVYLVTVFVAGRYTSDVVAWLNRTWGAEARLAGAIERKISLPAEAFKAPTASIPWDKVLEWLRDVPMPEAYKATLAQRVAEWSGSAGSQSVAKYIVQQIAGGVLSALVFVALSLVVGWLLALLGRLVSDQIKEIPLVGMANRLLGAGVQGLEVIVSLSIVVALVVPALSMYGMKSVGDSVAHSQLTPHLLTVYDWIRGLLFGGANGTFFAS